MLQVSYIFKELVLLLNVIFFSKIPKGWKVRIGQIIETIFK